MIAIARSIRCSFIMPPVSGHAPKRNAHIVHIMDKRSWRQASAIIIVRGVSKEALVDEWELGLDARKVKEHLAVHPDLERSGEITARGDHDLEEHPLSDGNGYRSCVSPAAAFSVVRTLDRNRCSRAPAEPHRIA